jgi:photosystem II stability/assembly factor-like uncharacterized protein
MKIIHKLVIEMTNHFSKIFYLGLFLAQISSYSQGTWERIDVPTNQLLTSVCFVDSLYGWAVGDSGTIIHTSDGGNTWVFQDSQTENEIVDVYFLNRDLGWASSFNYSNSPFGTVLLKTTNGGTDWIGEPYPEENIFINCIFFMDSFNGWMGGNPHALVRTTNGGITWQQADIDTSTLAFFPVMGIQFYNAKYGYACGGMFDIAGVIWRTSNGGDKWYAIDPSDAPADEVHALHIFDSLHVMGAGGDPDFGYGVGMIRTSDGGVNWEYEELGMQGLAIDLDFRNQTEAWAPLGQKPGFIYTLDAGLTWTETPTPDSTMINEVMFPDSIHGFAVGARGAVLKYIPPLKPSVEPISSLLPDEVIISQNYPNPFERSAKCKVQSAKSAHLVLKIYDVLGNEVATVLNAEIPPGSYEIPFDASGLPGGIYFYRLTATFPGQIGNSQITKKMVVIK